VVKGMSKEPEYAPEPEGGFRHDERGYYIIWDDSERPDKPYKVRDETGRTVAVSKDEPNARNLLQRCIEVRNINDPAWLG
jgi:hypothetical protein